MAAGCAGVPLPRSPSRARRNPRRLQAPRAAARGQPWRGQPWRRAGRRSCSWSASRTRGQRGRAERARVGLPPAAACHEGSAREPSTLAQTCRPCRAAADTSSGQTVMRRVPATTAVSVSSRERSWSDSKRRRLLAVSTAGRAPSCVERGRSAGGAARPASEPATEQIEESRCRYSRGKLPRAAYRACLRGPSLAQIHYCSQVGSTSERTGHTDESRNGPDR